MSRHIFVFGSNLAGRHGMGAAKAALEKHGAVMGNGVGLQGDSYAIPTKSMILLPLALWAVEKYIRDFMEFARDHPELTFDVTRIGCGLAGYQDSDIAPMFATAPPNVILPKAWGGEGFDE